MSGVEGSLAAGRWSEQRKALGRPPSVGAVMAFDAPEAGEGDVIGEQWNAICDSHVEQAPPTCDGLSAIHVGDRLPVGISK